MTLGAVAVGSDDDRCKAVSWRLNDMGVVAMILNENLLTGGWSSKNSA